MMVNIAVCGKFHYLNYAQFLVRCGVLNRLYFSHKIDAVRRHGLPEAVAANFWLKEYLTQGHQRFFGPAGQERLFPIYERLWVRHVLSAWRPARVFHYLANGTTTDLVTRARSEGSLLIAEAVNTHPVSRIETIALEQGVSTESLILERHRRAIRECEMADVLLVPSEHVSLSFRRHGFNKPIVKLPYGANINRFHFVRRIGREPAPLRIICVGQIGYRKGQRYLIEALKQLGGKAELTLVGPLAPEGKKILEGLPPNVRYLPPVQSDAIVRLLSEHEVFVLPSLEEGLAVSICEAMATGMPVVTTVEAGGSEIITPEKNGLLVPARSSPALVEAISRLMDPQIRKRLGESARASVESTANWERYAENLCRLYAELA